MRTLGKYFQNEDLVLEVLRFQNCSYQPRVTRIFESMNLAFMDLDNLFFELQEHDMELKILDDNEEGDKKNKSLGFNDVEEKRFGLSYEFAYAKLKKVNEA